MTAGTTVKDWMTLDLLHVGPGDPARRALEVMEHNDIRHVLVLDKGEIAGIVSNRDIVRVTMTNAGRILDLDGCNVAEIMTAAPLATIDADAPLREAAKLMYEKTISALPVTSDQELVGILSNDDVLAAVAGGVRVS